MAPCMGKALALGMTGATTTASGKMDSDTDRATWFGQITNMKANGNVTSITATVLRQINKEIITRGSSNAAKSMAMVST